MWLWYNLASKYICEPKGTFYRLITTSLRGKKHRIIIWELGLVFLNYEWAMTACSFLVGENITEP